jgi:solute carrier family 34 (sodium-dependent phosphate cotransporter)
LESQQLIEQENKTRNNIRIALYIIGAFLLFLFALDLMTSALQHLGKNVIETIVFATANPFTGLFIGLLITAMIQSSSTTTSLVVALVASGSITLENATPVIMGANVGTTITSTIVSLGFINKKKEFRRAVAAGTYHDFFNILTVIILFPLEYSYGFLSSTAQAIAGLFFTTSSTIVEGPVPHFWLGFDPVIRFLMDAIPSPFFLTLLSLVLLFASILIFRKLISNLLKARFPEAFSRFFFKSQLKSFTWGLITTAAIRSSTITTSVVVPIVAKKIVKLRQAAPFIMGANIGTTVTAFIAAMLNPNTADSLSIAIVHFLFNLIGVLIFFPLPILRKLPIGLASAMGKLTLKYRLAGFVYLLTAFFFLPFSLIFLSQGSIQSMDITYEELKGGEKSRYRLLTQFNTRTQTGEWMKYPDNFTNNSVPSLIYPVSVKNNTLFIGKSMFLFNRQGFCWDSEDDKGKLESCIEAILPSMTISNITFDSVYICRVKYTSPVDSLVHRYYVSAPYRIYLQHEVTTPQNITTVLEKVVGFETR